MTKAFIFSFFLLPLSCLAQFTITGRVLNKADKKPVENVSVFLSNATVGDKTAADGTFTLRNVKPGKYDLVVSDIAFETYDQAVIVGSRNLAVPDIPVVPQTRNLQQVTIRYKADPHRPTYYNWFKDEFLGTSELAKDCQILNPDVLDLSYDQETKTLTASSYDFLVIENDALGYREKYLLSGFSFKDIEDRDIIEKKTDYKGFVLFEVLKGTPGQQRRWERNRLEAYQNSSMHFLRAALGNKLDEEGFRVQKLAIIPNHERPADSLINSKIAYYKNLNQRDSLAYWIRKSKLSKGNEKLMPDALSKKDIVRPTLQPDQYELNCNSCYLYIGYSLTHHFSINSHLDYLNTPGNSQNTLIRYNSPEVTFYGIGVLSDPFSVTYQGVWARYRVAELLPVDYEPPQGSDITASKAAEIVARLDTFSSTHITEKTYMHLDKPYYAAGDTIYFKAYVTMGERHVPSKISIVLHADLINAKNKINQSIKLQLINGVAWGDFALPDSLPKGNYRIRAWTQWMRNDPGSYFEQVIPVGSLQKTKVPESGTSHPFNTKPDMQFFPEGGSLVTGIKSKVAFKAVGANGLGIGVKGVVLDNENKQVASFGSTHAGMGSFDLMPEAGKTYTAKLAYANGIEDKVDLPKVSDKGIELSINNDSIPKASVRIEANQAFFAENKNKEFSLLIYSGGTATTVPCELDSTVITLDILKRKLFTGITTVTLFSQNNEPLCERLIFIQNYDQLSLNLNTDKTSYSPREKVTVNLNARTRADSAAMGHFSVSVTDESKVPVDEDNESTILTNLLLTSDLKGYVEQPNYYFNNITDQTLKDLDLVMLTNGYRKFEWKQLLNSSYPPLAYQPENGLEISGVAKTVSGVPLNHGTVSLITSMGGPLQSQVTDDKGNFKFSNLIFTDTARYVLNATGPNGKNNTKMVLNKDQPGPDVQTLISGTANDTSKKMQDYLQNSKKQQDEIKFSKGKTLKEVKIKAFKEDNNYRSSSLLGPGHADQVMHADEIERIGGLLSTSLNGRLRGVYFMQNKDGSGMVPMIGNGLNGMKPAPMLLVVDGVQLPTGTPVDQVSTQSVETVEVLRFASASIYGSNGANGVLIITTKQGTGLQAKDIPSIGVLPVMVPGFYKAREFYSPKYEHQDNALKHPDLRSTIYWQPEVVTDKDGNASVDFYNADGTGNYRVIIEGIDEKGNIGRRVYRYKVK